eukprot:352022-Chlamydomonas_euryale.AAC.3
MGRNKLEEAWNMPYLPPFASPLSRRPHTRTLHAAHTHIHTHKHQCEEVWDPPARHTFWPAPCQRRHHHVGWHLQFYPARRAVGAGRFKPWATALGRQLGRQHVERVAVPNTRHLRRACQGLATAVASAH